MKNLGKGKSKRTAPKKATKRITYTAVEKCIYKVGNSYRVRVNGRSMYVPTLTMARKMRKTLREITTPSSRIW